MNTNCLTYDQLHAYSTHTLNKVESGHLYMHISSCELCASAVNGFAVSPFSMDELDAIHRQIDEKANPASANSLTFAKVLIVGISLLSIIGVYKLSDHIEANNAISFPLIDNTTTTLILPKNETTNSSPEEISSAAKTFKKVLNTVQYKKFEHVYIPAEQLVLIKPNGIASAIISSSTENVEVMAPHYDPTAVYIYDLKVSDYSNLYFTSGSYGDNVFHSHVPVSKENRTSLGDDISAEQHSVAADRVLKEGLAFYNKGKFEKALQDFNLLLDNNSSDVNAQFYSALAYYKLNRMKNAAERFDLVIHNRNEAFYPEASWCLALLDMSSGNKENAKKKLEDIVAEKGFYSKRAAEKLKQLSE